MMVAFRGRPLVVRVGIVLAAVAALLVLAGWQWSSGRTEARLNEDLFVECLSRAQDAADARQCTVDFYDRRDQQAGQSARGRRVATGVLLAEGLLPPGPTDPTGPRLPPAGPAGPATTATDPHLASSLPDRSSTRHRSNGGGEAVSSAAAPSAAAPSEAPPAEASPSEPAGPPEEPGTAPGPPGSSPTSCADQATTPPAARSCPAGPSTGGQDGKPPTAGTGAGKARPATAP